MSTELHIEQIPDRISEHLLNTVGGFGWQRSRHSYYVFPSMDTRPHEHLTFAVGILPSNDIVINSRQKRNTGLKVYTAFAVGWVHKLRKERQKQDERDAFREERRLVAALFGVDRNPGLVMRITGFPVRTSLGTDTIIHGEIAGEILHNYALA